jgi:hypothetical protein
VGACQQQTDWCCADTDASDSDSFSASDLVWFGAAAPPLSLSLPLPPTSPSWASQRYRVTDQERVVFLVAILYQDLDRIGSAARRARPPIVGPGSAARVGEGFHHDRR